MATRTPIPFTLPAAPVEPAEQRTLVVSEWSDAQFPIVRDDEHTIYLPVRALCLFLGIAGTTMQVAALQSDRVLRKHLRKFYVRGKGGRQPSWCLSLRAVAFWLAKVDINVVRPELQDGLVEWQETLIEAANALFWGGDIIAEEEGDPADMRRRMQLADLEIRRLKLQVRTHARRLALLERHALPAGTYFDIPDEPEE